MPYYMGVFLNGKNKKSLKTSPDEGSQGLPALTRLPSRDSRPGEAADKAYQAGEIVTQFIGVHLIAWATTQAAVAQQS